MELVIMMLEEQIRISENRLTTNHYPLEIEPTVRLKINQCKEAIDILRGGQNTSTSDDALHIVDVVERSEQLSCGRNITTCVFYKEGGKCSNLEYCRDQTT